MPDVIGAIRDKWLALGGDNFEHGFIDWTPQRGAQVHGPVVID